jgi:hypothetical protein
MIAIHVRYVTIMNRITTTANMLSDNTPGLFLGLIYRFWAKDGR